MWHIWTENSSWPIADVYYLAFSDNMVKFLGRVEFSLEMKLFKLADECDEHVEVTSSNLAACDKLNPNIYRFCRDKEQPVNNLTRSIAKYKSNTEFSNKDFNADKVIKYREVKKSMSRIFKSHPSHF